MRRSAIVLIGVLLAGCASVSSELTLQAYGTRLGDLCGEAATADRDRVDAIAHEVADMEGPPLAMDVGSVVAQRLRAGAGCPDLPPLSALEAVYRQGSEDWEARLDELRAAP